MIWTIPVHFALSCKVMLQGLVACLLLLVPVAQRKRNVCMLGWFKFASVALLQCDGTEQVASFDYAAALQETQLVAWEAVSEFGPFLWNPRHAAVFNAVQQCLLDTGELPARGPKSPTDALAQQVRRIRQKTLLPGNQRMRSAEQQYWEKHFPHIWSTRQMKDYYIPGGQLQNADSRRVFYRTPVSSGMLACELCGFNCDNHLDFLRHLRDEHLPAPADAAAHELGRCEEEYGKRMVFNEEQSGPFPVPGEANPTRGWMLCISSDPFAKRS